MSPFANPNTKKKEPPAGGPKTRPGKCKKFAGSLTMILLLSLLFILPIVAQAQERPPFEIVGSAAVGFSDLTKSVKDAGGGFQLGMRTKISDDLSFQALATKVNLGNSRVLRKVSTNLMYTFWLAKGSWIYLLFGAENNMGGTNPDPSTDLAAGLGGIFRVKTWANATVWKRPPTVDIFIQAQVIDGDPQSADAPLASGTYTEIHVGLSFAPGERLKTP